MYLVHLLRKTGKDILIRTPKKAGRLFGFLQEFQQFKRQSSGRFPVRTVDLYPCLTDRVQTTPFDQHYTYHPAWAARKLAQIAPAVHVDISSILSFGTIVSAFVPVQFYDYRPAEVSLSNFRSGAQDLKKLTFADDSIGSLSCMHTVEHIGLGRYGDELDPDGDLKAIAELKRVLKPGGDLLFVTPVGQPKLEFNAHRIYSYQQIIEAFAPLQLREFSLVPDSGGLVENADPAMVGAQQYGCGCFWFKK